MVSTVSNRQFLGLDSLGTEDLPLEFLHLELVVRVLQHPQVDFILSPHISAMLRSVPYGHAFFQGSPEKEKALSDLEHIGFNTGYRLIEKLTRDHSKFKDELVSCSPFSNICWKCNKSRTSKYFSGPDEIYLQGFLELYFQEANRQPQNKSSRRLCFAGRCVLLKSRMCFVHYEV